MTSPAPYRPNAALIATRTVLFDSVIASCAVPFVPRTLVVEREPACWIARSTDWVAPVSGKDALPTMEAALADVVPRAPLELEVVLDETEFTIPVATGFMERYAAVRERSRERRGRSDQCEHARRGY